MQDEMHYVYILKSFFKGVFYKGQTNNLEARLRLHTDGRVPATRKLLPVVLVHVEICETRADARKLEKYFKSGFGREIIKELFAN